MVWDERIDENLRKADAYFGGKDDGIREGILETQREVVINLFHNGVSKDIIAKSTNLTINEVNKIIENNNKSKV